MKYNSLFLVKYNTDAVRNAVSRRGPSQMGMGAQMPQGPHGQMPNIPGQMQQPQMMGTTDQYDPNQMQQQQQQQQQPGVSGPQQHTTQPGQTVSIQRNIFYYIFNIYLHYINIYK